MSGAHTLVPTPPTPLGSEFPAPTEGQVRAARAGWPQTEPDRSVWRILSCAYAGGDELTDAQIRAALPAFSLDEIAAARVRIAGMIAVETAEPPLTLAEMLAGPPLTLDALLAEPSITLDEAIASGLLEDAAARPAGARCA